MLAASAKSDCAVAQLTTDFLLDSRNMPVGVKRHCHSCADNSVVPRVFKLSCQAVITKCNCSAQSSGCDVGRKCKNAFCKRNAKQCVPESLCSNRNLVRYFPHFEQSDSCHELLIADSKRKQTSLTCAHFNIRTALCEEPHNQSQSPRNFP